MSHRFHTRSQQHWQHSHAKECTILVDLRGYRYSIFSSLQFLTICWQPVSTDFEAQVMREMRIMEEVHSHLPLFLSLQSVNMSVLTQNGTSRLPTGKALKVIS